MIPFQIIVFVFFFLISAFVFWRGLKEDYLPNQIFSSIVVALFSIIAGRLFGIFFSLDFWYLLTVCIVIVLLGLFISQNNIKPFEFVEFIAPGVVLVHISYFVGYLYNGPEAWKLSIIGLLLLVLFFYSILRKRYKSFRWYVSGKVGLSGLLTIAFTYLIFLLVEIISPDVILFSRGTLGLLFLSLLVIIPTLMVFVLSRKK